MSPKLLRGAVLSAAFVACLAAGHSALLWLAPSQFHRWTLRDQAIQGLLAFLCGCALFTLEGVFIVMAVIALGGFLVAAGNAMSERRSASASVWYIGACIVYSGGAAQVARTVLRARADAVRRRQNGSGPQQ